jgi:hypothetical protein
MPIYTKGKIPWTLIALIAIVAVFVVYILGQAVPALGVAILGGLNSVGVGIYNFFIVSPSYLSVFAAVGITAGVLILITQRKYFFKQKISNSNLPMAPTLQGGLINTSPLVNPMVAQQAMPISDGKTEVTTT